MMTLNKSPLKKGTNTVRSELIQFTVNRTFHRLIACSVITITVSTPYGVVGWCDGAG